MGKKLANQNAKVLKNALASAKRIDKNAKKGASKPISKTSTLGGKSVTDTFRSGGRLRDRLISRRPGGEFAADRYVFDNKQSRKLTRLFMKGADDKKFQLGKRGRPYTHIGVKPSGAEEVFHGKEKTVISTKILREASRRGGWPAIPKDK